MQGGTISVTDVTICADAAAADCTFWDDCSDADAPVADNSCVASAVLVRLPAASSISAEAVDTF